MLNGVLELLDASSRKRIEAALSRELAEVGLVHIAADGQDTGFFHYRVQLVTDPQGETFEPEEHCTAEVSQA